MSTNETNEINQATTPTPPIKPKNKTISFKDIQKQNKKANQLSTYILNYDPETNTNEVIKYYETFDQSRIDNLLTEAHINLGAAEDEGITFFQEGEQDVHFYFYISFLIAVRFTSLDKYVPSSVSEQMPMMMDLYNRGLLTRIHEEVLDQAEVARVTDKLKQFQSLMNHVTNLEDSTRNEILSSVQNKEILNYTQSQSNVIHPLVNPKADK